MICEQCHGVARFPPCPSCGGCGIANCCDGPVGLGNEVVWQDTQLPKAHCPYCDKQLDAASSLEGHTPKAGDVSVCIGCAQVLVFNTDMTVRKPTLVELHEIEADPKMQQYQWAVRQLDRRNNS